jgi:hypothetical protein
MERITHGGFFPMISNVTPEPGETPPQAWGSIYDVKESIEGEYKDKERLHTAVSGTGREKCV